LESSFVLPPSHHPPVCWTFPHTSPTSTSAPSSSAEPSVFHFHGTP
jgi:hypothetical protein